MGSGKVATDPAEPAEPKGSGMGQLFQSVIMMLGNVPKTHIRRLIVENAGEEPPFPISEDMDTHVNTAIDCICTAKGDWETFYAYIRQELHASAEEATAHLNAAAKPAD